MSTRGKTEKFLIIHADDLGMSDSVNRATFKALEEGLVTSASVMMPCPAHSEVIAHKKKYPEHDIGVHLTVTSEWRKFKWAPVADRKKVPSLTDVDGFFWPDVELFLKNAVQREVEIELRAQIEKAVNAGLEPTHLDSHMYALFHDPGINEILNRLSNEYGIPVVRFGRYNGTPSFLAPGKNRTPVLQSYFAAPVSLEARKWEAFYEKVLSDVPCGISQLEVHLAYDDVELRDITGERKSWSSAWRQRDFNVVRGRRFQAALRKENITLTTWKRIHETAHQL